MDLAVALGDRYTQSMISLVENGRSLLLLDGAIRAAKELDVSLDWLVGLSNDPSISTSRAPQPSTGVGEAPIPWPDAPGQSIEDASLKLSHARAYVVAGDSMRPALMDGSTILVDGSRTALRENHIFLYRTLGELRVRRAQRWPRGVWWWCSDNPNGDHRVQYDPEADEILGLVVWVGWRVAR